jgi:hypothetical protein
MAAPVAPKSLLHNSPPPLQLVAFFPTERRPKVIASNALIPLFLNVPGRVKIKMEYIGNKLRRYTTFSKRKTGIMKKAHELSTLTGTQVMLLVASETGHVYAFATNKLKPLIAGEPGKSLIQSCLNAPDGEFSWILCAKSTHSQ